MPSLSNRLLDWKRDRAYNQRVIVTPAFFIELDEFFFFIEMLCIKLQNLVCLVMENN